MTATKAKAQGTTRKARWGDEDFDYEGVHILQVVQEGQFLIAEITRENKALRAVCVAHGWTPPTITIGLLDGIVDWYAGIDL